MFEPDRVARCIELVEKHTVLNRTDIEQSRRILREPLMSLSLPESNQFMEWLRSRRYVDQFIGGLLVIDRGAVHPEKIVEFWKRALRSGRIDFCAEILTYASYTSISNGCFAKDTVVDIFDYEAAQAAIFHETFHTFNFVHGRFIDTGWNEGSAIALPKWYNGEACDLGETVFGTVLYYRDIGLEGYPRDVSIGSPLAYDKKGQEFARWLMGHDVSGVDWFSPEEVRRIFDAYWAPLNRNVAWEDWLRQVGEATNRMKREKRAHLS